MRPASPSMRAIEDLIGDLGLESSSSLPDRHFYARDLWPRHHIAVRDGAIAEHQPAGVVWPRNKEDVARIVTRCRAEGIPVVPYGAGSGVCGGVLPDERTVVIDTKRLEAMEVRGDVLRAGAGVMGIRLEEDLAARGHTLGHFPSSILCSTVGGWIAARSAGQCSGLYGKIEDMVVSLECVLGSGEIVKLMRRTQGPDLTPLMVGSEGIFGVVTEAELRVCPAPEARAFAAFSFPSTEAGWEAMREIFQAGLRTGVARLYDPFDSFMARRGAVSGKKSKRAAGALGELRHKLKQTALRTLLRAPSVLNGVIDNLGDRTFGGSMLILVFEGKMRDHQEDLARLRHIATKREGRDLGEGPARHWFSHRYAVSYRQAPVFMSGSFSDTMEVAAPWSRLKDLYEGVRQAMGPHVFVMAHFSHAYPDGCSIYFTFAGAETTRQRTEELYDRTWRDALAAVVAAGGTLSHHHGVGRSKAPRLGSELGLGVPITRAMGSVFDPAGIMNPGNLLPSTRVRRGHRARTVADDAPSFDDESLLVEVSGKTSVERLEAMAGARGMTLGLGGAAPGESVASSLAGGAPGAPAPAEDAVDHLIAGLVADLPSGDQLVIHPGPRRAVGPDPTALFLGMEQRVGTISSAHLRLHRKGLRARGMAADIERNPSIGSSERLLIESVTKAASRARFEEP